MKKTFRPYQPDQLLLLPPDLQEWLPDHHLARFVSDVVDTLDLTEILEAYDEARGQPPSPPFASAISKPCRVSFFRSWPSVRKPDW